MQMVVHANIDFLPNLQGIDIREVKHLVPGHVSLRPRSRYSVFEQIASV